MSLEPDFFPPDLFTIKTMIKGWRDRSDRLSITNNQHGPNRYSKAYLIKDKYANYLDATPRG